MKSLEVGSLVKSLITSMSVKKTLIGKIYPSVAPDKTKYPFLVYKRTGVTFDGDKDEYYRSCDVTLDLIIVGDSYTQSLDIASSISDEMPTRTSSNGFEVSEIMLTNASEDYVDDAYVQILTYNLTIDKL